MSEKEVDKVTVANTKLQPNFLAGQNQTLQIITLAFPSQKAGLILRTPDYWWLLASVVKFSDY